MNILFQNQKDTARYAVRMFSIVYLEGMKIFLTSESCVTTAYVIITVYVILTACVIKNQLLM